MRETLFGGGGFLLLGAIIARVRDHRKSNPERQRRAAQRVKSQEMLRRAEAEDARP